MPGNGFAMSTVEMSWKRCGLLGIAVVGLLGGLGSLGGCDGWNAGKKKAGYKPPTPLVLKGCKAQFRLQSTTVKGVAIQTNVKLRVGKDRLYTAVEHVLSAVDQGEHVVFDTARSFPIHAIAHPNNKKLNLHQRGKFGTQRSQTTKLAVRKGRPVRVTTDHNGGIVRGQRLEVKVHMARKGVAGGLQLPTVNVSAGWTGCPTVR